MRVFWEQICGADLAVERVWKGCGSKKWFANNKYVALGSGEIFVPKRKANFVVAEGDETSPFYRTPTGKNGLPRLPHWRGSGWWCNFRVNAPDNEAKPIVMTIILTPSR